MWHLRTGNEEDVAGHIQMRTGKGKSVTDLGLLTVSEELCLFIPIPALPFFSLPLPLSPFLSPPTPAYTDLYNIN